MDYAQRLPLTWRSVQAPGLSISALALILLLLAACSAAPYRAEPLEAFELTERAVIQEQDVFRVSAAVPSIDEAERLFGIPLSKRGIQPVWLKIENLKDERARFVPYSLDPGYFPPHEVAYMYRKSFSKQGWLDMEQRFFDLSIPRYIEPYETVSGFVFTHMARGTKAFNVDVFSTGGDNQLENFTFFINVPDFVPDHSKIDFETIYGSQASRDIDLDEFREVVADLPCCTTDQAASGAGQPIMIFLVGPGRSLLQALLRAGWAETSYGSSEKYLNSSDYYYGRPPDAIFRKGRNRTTERNEMGIWLLPYFVDGEPVWAVQMKHAIGRRFAIEEQFLGVQLDPDIDDGRNYLLQDLWYSQSLRAYAWSDSGETISKETPEVDFMSRAWFSDGFKIVLWISGDAIALSETEFVEWDRVVGFDGPTK
jgi:hypothetical protein